MSLKAVVWALENEEVFSSSQKFVLVALANYASEEGKSFPAVATICRMTKQSDDTVRRCLERLQSDNLIADTGKKYGPTQQVRVWQLPEEAWKVKDPPGAGLHRNGKAEIEGEDPGKTPARPRQDPRDAGRTLEPETQGTKNGAVAPSRRFSDGWIAAYQEAFKERYIYETKDGVAAARLLKHGVVPEDILDVAKKAWRQTDEKKFWACVHHSKEIPRFVSSYNAIRRELSVVVSKPKLW